MVTFAAPGSAGRALWPGGGAGKTSSPFLSLSLSGPPDGGLLPADQGQCPFQRPFISEWTSRRVSGDLFTAPVQGH